MDPKVKPPTRIVVSGGPHMEPRLYQAHPPPTRDWRWWLKLIAQAVVGVFLLWLFVSLFLLLGAGA